MAGAGFIRRYDYFPSTDELTAIEGVVIVDLPTPGRIQGTDYGMVAVVGEAQDMSTVCSVNTSGVVTSDIRPKEIYSGQDLLDKIGGFDRYLGDFGDEMGNLFVELRNKSFSRLVALPVDLIRRSSGDQGAIRIWRDLPTNRSATDTTPIVPGVGTAVVAGTTFTNSTSRAVLAQKVLFTGTPPKSTGVDGTTDVSSFSGTPSVAASVTITRASGSWITDGVVEGDAVVVGSLNAAAASQNLLCAGAGTLRVVSVDSATVITCQKHDGSNFTAATDWAAGSSLAYRVHRGSDADSGPTNQFSEAGGYTVLARPRVATTASGSALTPLVVPTAGSGTFWDVTSGLGGYTHPSTALTYEAAVHADNLSAGSVLRTRYQEALDALLRDDTPTNEVKIVTSARKDATIQAALRLHCIQASQRGLSRMTIISPKLETVSLSTVLGSAAPGVGGSGGAVRNERVIYSWPGCQTLVPEAIGVAFATPNSLTTDDGVLDVTMDTWVAALLSKLPPENNPGQAAEPVTSVFSPIRGYQRGCPSLDMNTYILFKQYGICALRMDRVVGPILQSGVTTSLTSGQTNINRRRMADYIQDSLSARYNMMAKSLGRQSIKDSLRSETDAFFSDMLSETNPEAQRIANYLVDDRSVNTPALAAEGIWVIKHTVQMLQTLDTIVCMSRVTPDAIQASAE